LDHLHQLRRPADVRERQGQTGEILSLTQKVADIHSSVLGPDHPATLAALGEHLSRHALEGDQAAVRSLRRRILRAMEKTLGSEDPIVEIDPGVVGPDERRKNEGTEGQ
jgi:hypothetical protein